MSRLLSSIPGICLLTGTTIAAAVATLHAAVSHTLAMQHLPWTLDGWVDPAAYALIVAAGALAVVPLLAFGLGCVRMALAHRRMSRLVAGADPRLVEGRTVWVLPLSDLTCFTAGNWRPRMFLSEAAIAHQSPETLEAVLLHEEEHLRQRAPLRRALLSLLEQTWWFVPGARRAVGLEALRLELAADDAALRGGAHRRSLFEAIVQAADGGPMAPAAGLATTGVAPRLERLAGAPNPIPVSTGWGISLALIATALAPAVAHVGLLLSMACL